MSYICEAHGDFFDAWDIKVAAARSRAEGVRTGGAATRPYPDPAAERDGHIAARRDFEQRVAAAEEARLAAYDDYIENDEEYDND